MFANVDQLISRSAWLRKEIFEMVITKKKGHIPSSFSMVEILVSLYYGDVLRFKRNDPNWSERDRLIVSKGHAAAALYPILADIGYIDKQELEQYTLRGGLLGMYADPRIPGIEAMSGSLGHGLGIASGICYAAKQNGESHKSYVILGDGECYEGSIWEGASFAAHHNLDNLIVIVDRNKLCIMGETESLLSLEPLHDKWEAFGWYTQRIDGHSYAELGQAINNSLSKSEARPSVIIADTAKGKGISWMEGQHQWHNKMPSDEQIEAARKELESNSITG